MGKIKFISAGMLTTIQDLGRYKYQRFGMPVAGAMDTYALQLANWLVGNKREEAGFEITFLGPKIEFFFDTTISLTGATIRATINNKPIFMDVSHRVKAGDILEIGAVIKGMRSYLAIAGSIDVDEVMGSKSTYLRAKIGGYHGRKIENGDEIAIKNSSTHEPRQLPTELLPIYRKHQVIRIIPGTEISNFDLTGLSTFLTSEYEVSNKNDRMGYRISGPPIQHKNGADIISSGITHGSIQVPGHGEPIIMMSDHQTVGGYTKIATVITVDLPLLAQMKTGDKISFKETTLEYAQNLLKKQNQNIDKLYQIKI